MLAIADQLYVFLDRWLMDTTLKKWEAKMATAETRIFVSFWVGEAHTKMMFDEIDDLRDRCFERTGCLIIRGIDDKLDKPQGVIVSFKVPTVAPPLA